MLTHQQIINYWSSLKSEIDLGIDWSEADSHCWRCGYESKLERCHIIPKSKEGSNEPNNIVLLCNRCHKEAPNYNDPRFMWIWIKQTSVPYYNLYWVIRGAMEFKIMFGRYPFHEIISNTIEEKQAKILLTKYLNEATIHWGNGAYNPSTLACVFARIEEELTGQLIVPKENNIMSNTVHEFFQWTNYESKKG